MTCRPIAAAKEYFGYRFSGARTNSPRPMPDIESLGGADRAGARATRSGINSVGQPPRRAFGWPKARALFETGDVLVAHSPPCRRTPGPRRREDRLFESSGTVRLRVVSAPFVPHCPWGLAPRGAGASRRRNTRTVVGALPARHRPRPCLRSRRALASRQPVRVWRRCLATLTTRRPVAGGPLRRPDHKGDLAGPRRLPCWEACAA